MFSHILQTLQTGHSLLFIIYLLLISLLFYVHTVSFYSLQIFEF